MSTTSNYQVSARKYRPQLFNTVVGQSHITTTLKNAIKNNQLAHAFLFCGPRGVGKTTCARILAKTINCENLSPETEACNTCNSCVSFNNGNSFNIHELDAASNNSVDDIRELTNQVRFTPQAGKYKIYIIDEVHMLSQAAFNAFLKTLEEPPAHAIFILATTEKHKILPTILSRCQIFDFNRITINDTVLHLKEICQKENISADDEALHIVAQKSEGCMRDSLSLMDKITSFTNGQITAQNTLKHLNLLDSDYFFKISDALLTENMAQCLSILHEIFQNGFDGEQVINGLAEHFRNILVAQQNTLSHLLNLSPAQTIKYTTAAQTIDPAYILTALNLLNDADIHYRLSKNKQLHVELVLLKLTHLNSAIQLVTTENYEVAKKKIIHKHGNLPKILYTPAPQAILEIETPTHQAKTVQATEQINIAPTAPKPQAATKPVASATQPHIPNLANLKGIATAAKTAVVSQAIDIIVPPIALLEQAFEQLATQYKTQNKDILYYHLNDIEVVQTTPTGDITIETSRIGSTFLHTEKEKITHYLEHTFSTHSLNLIININESKNSVESTVENPYQTLEKKIMEYPNLGQLISGMDLQAQFQI